MELFLFWVAFSILVGVFASVRRKRSGFGWFLLALVISPLIAGVLCAILREIEPSTAVRITPEYVDFNDLPASEQRRLMKFNADLAARR
jgi:hypothetical protein